MNNGSAWPDRDLTFYDKYTAVYRVVNGSVCGSLAYFDNLTRKNQLTKMVKSITTLIKAAEYLDRRDRGELSRLFSS